ncbi:MAG: hypothetical protein LLG37_06565 [Spirochaetia bacterium]|nr:hypothetical protein [Spirochaetia bacterium]
MVCGLLSAVMSSIDTAMLAPASILGNNVIPFFKKDMDDKAKLMWCKLFVPILGVASLIIALYFKNIYELALESLTVLLTSFTATPALLDVPEEDKHPRYSGWLTRRPDRLAGNAFYNVRGVPDSPVRIFAELRPDRHSYLADT